MGFAIPRIQYKNVDTTGDTTSGGATIIGISDTSEIEVGMFVRGTGIPSGAIVGSKATNSVTLDNSLVASATNSGVALSFGYEILFDYPPVENNGEMLENKNTTSESLSGIKQVSTNYIEATRKLTFSFLYPAIYALMDTFLRNHAVFGNSFRYYEDKTLTDYIDYELATLKTTPKKLAPVGEDTYVWELPLVFRRAL